MSHYDVCTYCGGMVEEHLVTKACWWGEELVAVVENVPAGVCVQCGERYYKANVLKQIDDLLEDRDRFQSVAIPRTAYKAA